MTGRVRALLLPLLLVAAPAAGGQSLLDRPPNLAGTWAGAEGVLRFHLVHRFSAGPAPARKVSSAPTFLLGGTPTDGVLLGARYSTNSQLVGGVPNEWEAFGRWHLLREEGGAPVDLALAAAYNDAARSADGEVTLARRFGGLRALLVGRAFSDRRGTGDFGGSVAAGAVVRLRDWLSVAGDGGRLLDAAEGEDETVWGVGVQLRIPSTPHTLSLQATNTNSGTLQGSAHPAGRTRYGFAFTVPLTLSRYFGGSDARAEDAVTAAGDTVRIRMSDLAFEPASVRIRPGTVVVWTNDDPVVHTATSDRGEWDSGELDPGESWSRVFRDEGEHPYHCTPHPFMTGTIVVEGGP